MGKKILQKYTIMKIIFFNVNWGMKEYPKNCRYEILILLENNNKKTILYSLHSLDFLK